MRPLLSKMFFLSLQGLLTTVSMSVAEKVNVLNLIA